MYSISSTFTLVINFIFGKGKGWHMGERNSDKKKITAKEFKNMISNGEKIEDSIVLEDIDLKNQIFCNLEIVDVEFQKSVDFSNSVFTGNTFFTGTSFRFHTNFSNAIFQMVCFERTSFPFGPKFENVVFTGFDKHNIFNFSPTTSFENSFLNSASFENAVFNGDTSFSEVIFFNTVNFQGTIFKNDISFYKIKPKGMFDLSNCLFGKDGRVVCSKGDVEILRYTLPTRSLEVMI